MKTIHLVLKYRWFDMIASGKKLEEYREIKPYYEKLRNVKKGDRVVFHRGYSNVTITKVVVYCLIGHGLRVWGGDPEKESWVIGLKDCN